MNKGRCTLEPNFDAPWPYIKFTYKGWATVSIDCNTLRIGEVYVKDGNLRVDLLAFPLCDITQSEDEIVALLAALKLAISLSQ